MYTGKIEFEFDLYCAVLTYAYTYWINNRHSYLCNWRFLLNIIHSLFADYSCVWGDTISAI